MVDHSTFSRFACWPGAAILLALGAPADVAAAECRLFEGGTQRATLQDERISEASGLAAGWKNPEVFWVHNDSGDSARLFAIDQAGNTLTEVTLAGITATDWEDLAVGPCAPDTAAPCIWIADIGDNLARRDDIRIHRFPEPELGPTPPAQLTIEELETIDVTYADGPVNAETLLVHPVTAEVFILSKGLGDPNDVWQVPTDAAAVTAQKIASFNLGEPLLGGGLVTGGDFAPSGTEIAIRTYSSVYTFCGPDPIAAFASTPTKVTGFDFFQSETLTYSRGGESLWTTSEALGGNPVPLVEMPRVQPVVMEPDVLDPAPAIPDVGTGGADSGADLGAPVATNGGQTGAAGGCNCTHAGADPRMDLGFLALILAAAGIRTATGRSRSCKRARA